jgi:hypothetical protein
LPQKVCRECKQDKHNGRHLREKAADISGQRYDSEIIEVANLADNAI